MFYPTPSPGLANKDPGLGSGSSSWGRHTSFNLGGGNNGGSGVPPPSPGYGINGYSFNHVVGGGQGHGNQPSFGGGNSNGPGGLGHQGASGLGHSMGHGGHQSGLHGHGHGMGGMQNGMGGQGNGVIGPGRGQGQGGSPPMGRAEPSAFWQQQMVRAEACRQQSSPHHRARASAMASRMQKNPLPILDPNRPPSSLSITHRKNTSMASTPLSQSVNGTASHLDRDDSSTDTGSPVPTPAHPSGISAPVLPVNESTSSEPWQGIDLGGIRLKTLTSSLFAFTHITSLYINHNHLTSLSPAISDLRQLNHLDATGNQLASVPPELGLITPLKELLLFDNNITDLPLELGTLCNLEFLGIEGNPISESLRIAMSEKGTQGLISYFLNNCPLMPPPPPRNWEIVDDGDGGEGEGDEDSFSLLSYNALGERYANTQTYPYTPTWALEWSWRMEKIYDDMTGPGTDIICLQEVEDVHYNDFFRPKLRELGYEGVYSPKTRARTMTSDEKRFVDGSATFWKASKYHLIESHTVEYNQLALSRADMRTDDMFNRVMRRDDVALVCTFENPVTDTRLIVANTHIVWDPQYRDVKLVQVAMLMDEVDRMATQFAKFPPKLPPQGEDGATRRTYSDATKIPMIVCGDFNSIPASGVYDFFTKGVVPPDHEDFMDHKYGNYTSDGPRHRFHLRSAYDSIGELPLTNYTPQFEGSIDYIWYSGNTMSVTGFLGEVDKGYLSKIVGFPHGHFPSDHIPVAASFKMKSPTPPVNGTRYHR